MARKLAQAPESAACEEATIQLQDIFTFHGRLRRIDFVTGLIAVVVVAVLVQIPLGVVQRATTTPPLVEGPAELRPTPGADPSLAHERRLGVQRLLFSLAIVAWPLTALHARRLRDIGWSPWLAAVVWIPVVGWAVSAACCVLPAEGEPWMS